MPLPNSTENTPSQQPGPCLIYQVYEEGQLLPQKKNNKKLTLASLFKKNKLEQASVLSTRQN